MSSVTANIATPPPRVALRPIALPSEHGGWGFLFEPLVLGMAVAPSWAGLLIAVAAICGFLTRQPLKFAMQDALRRKSYPRTRMCWIVASTYAAGALGAISAATLIAGWQILVPFAAVAPLALIALAADARNQSRALVPELAGAVAMTSTAAAIAIAAGRPWIFVVLLIARAIPSIVYVRALLARAHGKVAGSWPSIALHVAAIGAAWTFGWFAIAAMIMLLVRALFGLTHEVPRAKTVGWREIAFGTVTIALFILSSVL